MASPFSYHCPSLLPVLPCSEIKVLLEIIFGSTTPKSHKGMICPPLPPTKLSLMSMTIALVAWVISVQPHPRVHGSLTLLIAAGGTGGDRSPVKFNPWIFDSIQWIGYCSKQTCTVRSRMRLGMTESEVRRMLEKAANQWIKEESSGDKRGGAGEVEDTNNLSCFMFVCRK